MSVFQHNEIASLAFDIKPDQEMKLGLGLGRISEGFFLEDIPRHRHQYGFFLCLLARSRTDSNPEAREPSPVQN